MRDNEKLEQMMIQLKPVYSKISGGEPGEPFDDARANGNLQKPGRIIGIEVRSGYIVDAIGVIHEGEKVSSLHGNKVGGESHKVIFEEGDGLKSIKGEYGVPFGTKGTISRLVIETRKGKSYGPFGTGGNGNAFCITIPEETELIGFYGNTNPNPKEMSVVQLGVIYNKGKMEGDILNRCIKETMGKPIEMQKPDFME